MNTQILIAGAGPVGLTMAAELARFGISVRILDKASARTDKSKALVLWSRTLELLERAGASAAFVENGVKALSANIVAGGSLIGHVSFEGASTPYPYALMIPQSETERLLETHLESLGVTVERQVELTAFEDDGTGITSVVAHPGGTTETIKSAWLIGCDGAHSLVRHGLKLSFEGNTLASDFILADIHLTGLPSAESAISTFWHEEGVLVFFPISPGRVRVIADIGPSTGTARRNPTLEEVQAIVDARGPGGIVLSDPVWLSSFAINERKVADYRIGRVFLAGDAAHIHSPAGGQGMNTGMQDAFNLSWKLALVCKGLASPGLLLDSYSAERSAVGDKVLADAGRLTKMAMLRNPVAQAVRNFVAHHLIGLPFVQHAMTDTLSELAIAYRDSPLTQKSADHSAGPKAGARVPPAAGDRPFGAGQTPRFAICAKDDPEFRVLADDHAATLEPELRRPLDATAIHLVRPDGYVALVVAAGQWREIDAYLRRVTSG